MEAITLKMLVEMKSRMDLEIAELEVVMAGIEFQEAITEIAERFETLDDRRRHDLKN